MNMTDSNTKIGWVLSGSEVVPGARIQGFNIHGELCEQGIDSNILVAPDNYSLSLSRDDVDWQRWIQEGYSTIVFQKVFEGDTSYIGQSLRAAGIRTVYLACDLCGHNMVDTCDATIAVSSFLKKAFGRRRADRITVIPDGLEVPADRRKQEYRLVEKDRLKAVYVGSAFPAPEVLGELSTVADVADLTIVASQYEPHSDPAADSYHASVTGRAKNAGMMHPADSLAKVARQLLYMCRRSRCIRRNGDEIVHNFVAWNKDTVCDVIMEHDVAVIASFLASDPDMAKSSNRLTMFMSLGMPVIASPVPSYTEIVRDGENAFIASSRDDWIYALEKLREPGVAEIIGHRAREEVIEEFSLQATARKYLEVARCGE